MNLLKNILIIAFFTISITKFGSASEIYQWTDKNGNVHFSNQSEDQKYLTGTIKKNAILNIILGSLPNEICTDIIFTRNISVSPLC